MRHPLPELPPRLFCQPSSSQIGTAMVLDDEALHGIAGVVCFPCSIWQSCSRPYLWHGRGVCLKSYRQWSSGQIGGQWCVFFEWIPNDFTFILRNLVKTSYGKMYEHVLNSGLFLSTSWKHESFLVRQERQLQGALSMHNYWSSAERRVFPCFSKLSLLPHYCKTVELTLIWYREQDIINDKCLSI